MKTGRLITLLFILLISGSAYAQVDSVPLLFADSLKTVYIYADTGKAINRIDAQGRKQGLWEKKYPNGKLRYRGHFYNDNPAGVFKYYWDNDSVQNIAIYSDHGKRAFSHMFYENGGLFATGKFISQKRDSIWLFYDPYYKLYKKEQYVLGKKQGKSIIFYSNGSVEETKSWDNGLENGPWQQFFEDGQLKLEANYVKGKREGMMKVYNDGDPDHPSVEGTYRNDLKDGKWIYRNDQTLKVDTVEYKNDVLLNPGKYRLSQHKLDSMRTQNEEMQQRLQKGGMDQDYDGR